MLKLSLPPKKNGAFAGKYKKSGPRWWLNAKWQIMHNQALIFGILSQGPIDKTMQNFINKHVVDLENVQSYKKKDKGEVVQCQVSSN
jgi:hypothetical protein